MTKTYSSGKHKVMNADPTPWVGADGSRRARYSRFAPRFDPRPKFGIPLTNGANPILVAFREDAGTRKSWWGPREFTESWVGSIVDQFEPYPKYSGIVALSLEATQEQRDHARKVLTRLANFTKEN